MGQVCETAEQVQGHNWRERPGTEEEAEAIANKASRETRKKTFMALVPGDCVSVLLSSERRCSEDGCNGSDESRR